MTTLPFADTHNLVAFLDKPAESEGFEQIVDFLKASSIRYALTVNPTIDLQLEDAKGIACLPNADIFEQLALMGYEKPSQKLTFYKAFFSPQWKFLIHTILQCLSAKSTAWNEFSSTVASAIICLARNSTFLIFLNQQAGDMSNHKRIYVTPSHTKKVFRNMKREGKGFSGTSRRNSGSTEPIADEAVNEENVPTQSNDPPLSKEDASKQGRKIDDIDQDAKVTLVDETQGRYDDAQMFDTYVFDGEEVFVVDQSKRVVEEVVNTAKVSTAATITTEEITLA
ncbi:hypothetical protein Tco_1490566 [Tanacetum coccineum]